MKPLIARATQRGAVTRYETSSLRHSQSRAFNHLEADPPFIAIEKSMQDAIHALQARYARKFLAYYRKRLNQHRVGRHKITLSCAMGCCAIKIDNTYLYDWPTHRQFPVLLLLAEIQQSMDWHWAWHLDGQNVA